MTWERDWLRAHERMVRAAIDGQIEADRLDAEIAREEIAREHRGTCALCIGGGDCPGPWGDWIYDYEDHEGRS